MSKELPETKLELAKKAFAMILYGIEPLPNERLEDYVKRGSKKLEEVAEEETYAEETRQ